MAARRPTSAPAISDKAVSAKTGRIWKDWFAELDRAGADGWNHKSIAKHLREGYGIDSWWAQTVAVAYERARGLRDKYEQADGYQIQVERIVRAPLEEVWPALRDEKARLGWLPDSRGAAARGVREDKHYLRLDWPGGSRVLMGVNAKSVNKCSVGVQQSRLPSASDAAEAKRLWALRLERLKAILAAE